MLKQLDHVNVRTRNLSAMSDWYGRILGMSNGPRPEFSFGGAWLYIGDHPVIHLVDATTTDGPDAKTQLEHIAFRGEDYQQFISHLQANSVEFSEFSINDDVASMTQVHVRDVDGNHIHIDFPPAT